ncbi:uncharacterized protein [Palaemon carinicauda]|uniref:uncharacterized protein n=1 Tax=Palaemon carinicauda TaxID=392227 RepID=UPI0035B62441
MSAQKIKNKKAQLRQKLGGEGGSARFLFTKSSPSGLTSIKESKLKSEKFELQNDLISGLPKSDTSSKPKQKLDIISNCPNGPMDDFDGVDHIIAVSIEVTAHNFYVSGITSITLWSSSSYSSSLSSWESFVGE